MIPEAATAHPERAKSRKAILRPLGPQRHAATPCRSSMSGASQWAAAGQPDASLCSGACRAAARRASAVIARGAGVGPSRRSGGNQSVDGAETSSVHKPAQNAPKRAKSSGVPAG